MDKKVIVIGSGIAGLSIAIRLAARDFHVSILEANAWPGGKLTQIRCPERTGITPGHN